MTIGDRRFVEIPGGRTHELPPLLVHSSPAVKRLDRVMEMAEQLISQEDILPDSAGAWQGSAGAWQGNDGSAQLNLDYERRRIDLAVNLTEQYLGFVFDWTWGNDVLEWIRQCEITFGHRPDLRNLLRADLWPHANRSSFVTLLEDKSVDTQGVLIEKAVGLRLTFRQPPPLRCFSDQFLLYLNSPIAETAYTTWAGMNREEAGALPPERFTFDVLNMSLQ